MDASNPIARVLDAFQGFFESKRRCLVFSIVLATVLMFLATAAWSPHDVNDDFSMALAVSGNWGADDGRSLFLNIVLNTVLYWLNTQFPVTNWYVLYEVFTAYVALIIIIYLSLTRSSLPAACLLITAALLLVLPGCSFIANFSLYGTMNVCAGAVMLMCSLKEERHRAGMVVAGLLFMMFGAMLRIEIFFLCIPAFGIAALAVTLRKDAGERDVLHHLLRLWPFVVALGLSGLLFAVDMASWQEEPWHTWRAHNAVRSAISDYEMKDYDEIADELKALGVSENDYEMLNSWMTEDADFFTTELYTELLTFAPVDRDDSQILQKSVAKCFKGIVGNDRLMLVLCLALVVFICTYRKLERPLALLLLLVALGVSLYFALAGRIPRHVLFAIWTYSVAASVMLSDRQDAPWRLLGGDSSGGKHAASGSVGRILALGAGIVALAVPVAAAGWITYFSINHFSVERLEATYCGRTFEPDCTLVEYYREHPDNFFVKGQDTETAIRFPYMLRGLLDHDTLYQECSLGGWTCQAPFVRTQLDTMGMHNAIQGLVANESARLVWHDKKPEVIATYLREHYYPNCTYTVVDEIECEEMDETLYIIDFEAE